MTSNTTGNRTPAAPDRAGPTSRRPGWRWWATTSLFGLTAYSTALGWQAQAVSYPLFRAVSAEDFLAYHAQYNASIPGVVIVPGFVAFLAGVAYPWFRPAGVSRRTAAVVALAGLVSVLSTVAWAIPRHDLLDRIGQDDQVITELLQANLVRSLALTVGTAALAWGLSRADRRPHPEGR